MYRYEYGLKAYCLSALIVKSFNPQHPNSQPHPLNCQLSTVNSQLSTLTMLSTQLREIPLFQGLTSDNLMQIIGQTKFKFSKFGRNETIKHEGEVCNSLAMLISGEAISTAYADDHGYAIDEYIKAPYILQPEHFTGLSQHYTRTFTSIRECDIVEIGQSDIMHISDEFIIFRINLLNIISAIAQKSERKHWHPMPTDTRARIVHFVKTHCLYPTGSKTVRIKMTRLAQEIGNSRLNVSEALNKMRQEGLLEFSRGIIRIPQVERLR